MGCYLRWRCGLASVRVDRGIDARFLRDLFWSIAFWRLQASVDSDFSVGCVHPPRNVKSLFPCSMMKLHIPALVGRAGIGTNGATVFRQDEQHCSVRRASPCFIMLQRLPLVDTAFKPRSFGGMTFRPRNKPAIAAPARQPRAFKKCQHTSLNILGMVMGAWLVAVKGRFREKDVGDSLLFRRHNEPSVTWMQQRRGGKEPRSWGLMRFLCMV